MKKKSLLSRLPINIVKIGTNILTTEERKLDVLNLKSLITQISKEYSRNNAKFIIVTSGSITCGSEQMDIIAKTIPEKQAAAAVGQILLMQEYMRFFKKNNIMTGQILLTKDCITSKVKKKNAENTIFTLLEQNIIPVINENDSIATDEIGSNFGDNDNLSSKVAKLVNAKRLIILTDIDGLFTANPKKNKSAELITSIKTVSRETFLYIKDEKNNRSRGGMYSKILSAQYASKAGTEVIIANGRRKNILTKIFNGTFTGTTVSPVK